jgi:hypothetical protein
MTIDDAECQWDLIRDLWNQLDLDDVLARDWPIEKRWQVDLLLNRMRAMDEMFDEYAYEQLLNEWELDESERT